MIIDLSGPVVRIGPNEIHCNDAAFVDEIYAAGGRKRNKQAHYLGVLAGPTTKSAFGTLDHDLHRIRRNAMNKFFSRAQITRLEPEMLKLTQLLCDKLISMKTLLSHYPRIYADISHGSAELSIVNLGYGTTFPFSMAVVYARLPIIPEL
jgi:cytochrome P450